MGDYDSARKFIRRSYDRSDNWAKERFSLFLEGRGHVILFDREDFEHDIVTERDGDYYFFELETKTGRVFRDRSSFPFSTVSFLGRMLFLFVGTLRQR